MPRVDPAEVIALFGEDPGTELVDAAIADASAWIDANLVGVCPRLDAAALETIEKYLAAHLLQARSEAGGQIVQATRGDVSERYARRAEGEAGEFVRVAAALDPCGIVAQRWGGRKRAVMRVGKGYASTGGP